MTGHDKNFKERGRESEGGRGERERAIVCSPLPLHFLLHSSENDISSPPKELLFSFALRSSLPFKLSLLFSYLCQISLMMELFVPLNVPSRTALYSQLGGEPLHLWLNHSCVFSQDATEQPTGETSWWCSMGPTQPTVPVSFFLTHTHTLIILLYATGNEQSPGCPPTHPGSNRGAGVE